MGGLQEDFYLLLHFIRSTEDAEKKMVQLRLAYYTGTIAR